MNEASAQTPPHSDPSDLCRRDRKSIIDPLNTSVLLFLTRLGSGCRGVMDTDMQTCWGRVQMVCWGGDTVEGAQLKVVQCAERKGGCRWIMLVARQFRNCGLCLGCLEEKGGEGSREGLQPPHPFPQR